MHVAKKYLLLTAGIVWAAAGFNIVRIGWLSTSYMSIATAAAAVITFLIFYHMIFKKLIHKHTERILANTEDRMHILRFFDAKSYIIMICMMSFGIALRASASLAGCMYQVLLYRSWLRTACGRNRLHTTVCKNQYLPIACELVKTIQPVLHCTTKKKRIQILRKVSLNSLFHL